jgi:hypothetical protein
LGSRGLFDASLGRRKGVFLFRFWCCFCCLDFDLVVVVSPCCKVRAQILGVAFATCNTLVRVVCMFVKKRCGHKQLRCLFMDTVVLHVYFIFFKIFVLK